jgi:DNA-binding NtrC family response regulator
MPPRQHSITVTGPREPDHPDRPRVLLVDPDDAARARCQQALTHGGCVVVAAVPNYAQAMVGARTHAPSVIVTELCGEQILTPAQYVTALRRFCPAPVIVLGTEVPSADQIADWGLWTALVKGADIRELLEVVRAAHEAMRTASPLW